MARADYTVQVDWLDTGLFGGAHDDVTGDVHAPTGIVFNRGRDSVRALAPPAVGRLSLALDNRSRKYALENAASPLAGRLVPGHRIRVRATYNAQTYDLWRGWVDDIPQRVGTVPLAYLPSLGPLSRLQGRTISTPLYQAITTGTAINVILDACGIPASERRVDPGQTLLRWWWLDEQDALQAAVTLLNSEGLGAALYESGDGKIVFEDRYYRLRQARCLTPQAVFRDSGTEPCFEREYEYAAGLKDCIHVATATVNRREYGDMAVVWQLGEPLGLGPNETRKLTVSAGDPFSAAIVPQAGTDYKLLLGSVSFSLNRTTGSNVELTATAGPGGCYVEGLQLRASPLLVTGRMHVADDGPPSGTQSYQDPIWPEMDYWEANSLLDEIVRRYKAPRATVTLTMSNDNPTRLAQILQREISDRVTIIEGQTGVNADFFIESIRHEIRSAGAFHTVQFGCEKCPPDEGALGVWDETNWDECNWVY